MTRYDERELVNELSLLDRFRKAAFASACAERLMSLFQRYSAATGDGNPDALRGVLDNVWRAVGGDEVHLVEGAEVAESMVPSDGDEWVFEMGYGQNATAAVAYAARAWISDGPQEAAWAARQVYEAADLAAQQSLPDSANFNRPTVEQQLEQSPGVRAALAGIASDLHEVRQIGSLDWRALRDRARTEGADWSRSLA